MSQTIGVFQFNGCNKCFNESLLLKISDSFKYGIKSEKQYQFYANKLTAMGKG